MSTLHRILASVSAVALVLLVGASPARAQRSIDVHLFNPSVDAEGMLAVERAETLAPWTVGFKLGFDFALAPLSARMTDPSTGTIARHDLIDWQLISHLGLAFGIQRWLEAVIDLPVSVQSYGSAYGQPLAFDDPTLSRTGFYASDPSTTQPPPGAGPLDLRLGVKSRIYRNRWVGLGALALLTLPIGNDNAFLGEGTVTFRPTLVADTTLGNLTVAVNLGAVVRKSREIYDPAELAAGAADPRIIFAAGHELTWSAGVGYRILPWLAANAEVLGLEPLVVPAGAVADRTIDVQAGLRFFPSAQWSVYVGGGGNVTPDADRHETLRVFAGVGWLLATRRDPRAVVLEPGNGNGDRDADGIPDSADRCPDEPEDRDSFQDNDGCPDPDNDGDGVPDAVDRCPNEPEDRDGYEDQDGCPDLDNDGDDIPDAIDRCPNEPETRNGIDDGDGCPDSGGYAPVQLDFPLIAFDAGKSSLDGNAEAALVKVAEKLQAATQVRRIRIEGHADAGEGHAGTALSQARALAVREFLMKRGVDGARLQAVGYGAARPRATGTSAAVRAGNRRVELVVVEQ
jgi:outer membrane protein OmpA-like peptidoglycan-associated protein